MHMPLPFVTLVAAEPCMLTLQVLQCGMLMLECAGQWQA